MAPRFFLYVEDDDAAFFLLQHALREVDPHIQLCRVSDGEQAIAFLQKSEPYENAPRPDLILLDVNLPKRSGFDVLRVLKGTESLRAIPVIMFSTSSIVSDRDTSMALGAQKYVTKPPGLERFMEVVKAFTRSAEDPP